jgi:hypothetical protein
MTPEFIHSITRAESTAEAALSEKKRKPQWHPFLRPGNFCRGIPISKALNIVPTRVPVFLEGYPLTNTRRYKTLNSIRVNSESSSKDVDEINLELKKLNREAEDERDCN